MHARIAVFATLALITTGLPLVLAVPLGPAHDDLEIREPSRRSFSAFQIREELRAASETGTLSEPPKTTKPALPVAFDRGEQRELLQFMAQSKEEGATVTIQNVTFTIQGNNVLVDNVLYTRTAVMNLTKQTPQKVHSKRNLGSTGLGALQRRDERHVFEARKLSDHPKTTKPQLDVKLSNKDKSKLTAFLADLAEGSQVTVKEITFTHKDDTFTISTDPGYVYTESAIRKLLKRNINFKRDLTSGGLSTLS